MYYIDKDGVQQERQAPLGRSLWYKILRAIQKYPRFEKLELAIQKAAEERNTLKAKEQRELLAKYIESQKQDKAKKRETIVAQAIQHKGTQEYELEELKKMMMREQEPSQERTENHKRLELAENIMKGIDVMNAQCQNNHNQLRRVMRYKSPSQKMRERIDKVL